MAYNPKTGKGLGRFYSAEHRAFRAREWRGFRDTFYDFFRWLYLYGFMAAKLGCHPILMVKAMLRYRWMVSYLTAAHMVDRHTMGLRGKELRYAHNQFFSVLHNSVLGVRDIILRDKNLRPNSKHAAKLRENTVMFDEMTPHLIMMGFPTVKWIDIAMFAIGLPSEVDQNASMFYIDAMEHLGLPAAAAAGKLRGNLRPAPEMHGDEQAGLDATHEIVGAGVVHHALPGVHGEEGHVEGARRRAAPSFFGLSVGIDRKGFREEIVAAEVAHVERVGAQHVFVLRERRGQGQIAGIDAAALQNLDAAHEQVVRRAKLHVDVAARRERFERRGVDAVRTQPHRVARDIGVAVGRHVDLLLRKITDLLQKRVLLRVQRLERSQQEQCRSTQNAPPLHIVS